jgi:hypothetical protein
VEIEKPYPLLPDLISTFMVGCCAAIASIVVCLYWIDAEDRCVCECFVYRWAAEPGNKYLGVIGLGLCHIQIELNRNWAGGLSLARDIKRTSGKEAIKKWHS